MNTYTTGHQQNPALAADGLGNFVVVWESYGQDGNQWGVFGQRFDSAGAKVGSEFQVNTYTTSDQLDPAVATDESGNFVVVWESGGEDGSYTGVFGQRYDATGLPLGSEFQVNTFTTNYQSYPAVAADGLGNFVVVWSGAGQDASGGVSAQRFDSAGVKVGSEFQVNSYEAGYQGFPAVDVDGTDNFVVVWASDSQDGSGFGLFGQRFSSAGSPVGSEFQINTYTPGHQALPVVAVNSSGSFVVAWESDGQDGNQWGIFGQRFDSAATPLGTEFQVNSHTGSYQAIPALAMDSSGGFLVAWRSWYQDGWDWGVFGQRFDSAGSTTGGEFQINSHWTSRETAPAVTADGSGDFIVTWQSAFQEDASANYGVVGSRLADRIFSNGFELGDVCAWSAAVGGGCP